MQFDPASTGFRLIAATLVMFMTLAPAFSAAASSGRLIEILLTVTLFSDSVPPHKNTGGANEHRHPTRRA